MIKFNRSESSIWSVPNDYPSIGTEDGGVIGSSGIVYDSLGRAIGQGALPGWPSWQGFMYSVVDDPFVVRTVPPDGFLNANLLQVAGGNVSNSTAPPWKDDDPYSLRLVPTSDDGAKGASERNIVYNLFKMDRKSNPTGHWYLTEHQTLQSLAGPDGMSGGIAPAWQFHDTLRCPVENNTCGPSHQTFTISPNQGVCASPSYGDPGNSSTCNPVGSGKIVVHDLEDFGVLWLGVNQNDIQINGYYKWPGVKE
jgi:hypothetical protein